MHALAKCGLATVLVASAVASNLVVALSVLSSADAQARRPEALDWQTFQVAGFGTTVEYPAGIFSVPDGKADKGVGERFKSDIPGSRLVVLDGVGHVPQEEDAAASVAPVKVFLSAGP